MAAAAIPLISLAIGGAGLGFQMKAQKQQKKAQGRAEAAQQEQFAMQQERVKAQEAKQTKDEESARAQFGRSKRSLLRSGGRRQTFFQGQEVNPETFAGRTMLG